MSGGDNFSSVNDYLGFCYLIFYKSGEEEQVMSCRNSIGKEYCMFSNGCWEYAPLME